MKWPEKRYLKTVIIETEIDGYSQVRNRKYWKGSSNLRWKAKHSQS